MSEPPSGNEPLWRPSAERIAASNLARFMAEVERIPDAYEVHDGVKHERLVVLRGTLS